MCVLKGESKYRNEGLLPWVAGTEYSVGLHLASLLCNTRNVLHSVEIIILLCDSKNVLDMGKSSKNYMPLFAQHFRVADICLCL